MIDISSITTDSSSEYISCNLHHILSLIFGISLPLVLGIPNAVLIVVQFMLEPFLILYFFSDVSEKRLKVFVTVSKVVLIRCDFSTPEYLNCP